MLEIHLQDDISRDGFSVYAFIRTQHGRIPFRVTVERLPEVPRDHYAVEPSCVAERGWIDPLIKGLQEANLLPKVGATEAELKATKYHLEDFRKLAFDQQKYITGVSKDAS